MTVGNALFAFNRYGLHQFFELVFYATKTGGPVRKPKTWNFTDDLAEYVNASFRKEDMTDFRQHIMFRVSSVLLLLTISEIAFFFCFYQSNCSIFYRHRLALGFVGFAALIAYAWQLWLTRRIDYYFVTNRKLDTNEYPEDTQS